MTDAQINSSETNTPQTHLEPTAKHAGRPRLFKTPEEMQAKITAYFESRKPVFLKDDSGKILTNPSGSPMVKKVAPTESGLALFLGFSDRSSLYEYLSYGDEFSHTVKSALLYMEDYAENCLLAGDNIQGAIFWLKNKRNWNAEEKREEAHSIDLSGSLKVDNAQTVKEAVQEVLNECFDTPPTPKQ